MLLNLDTEDEGIFTIGCAGGRDTKTTFKPEWIPACSDNQFVRVKVGGLAGGHSGGDIHLPKGNANVILARVLDHILEKVTFKIAAIDGGSAHNAIPRDSHAVLSVKPDSLPELKKAVGEISALLKDEFAKPEPELKIELIENEKHEGMVMNSNDSVKFVNMMMAMPHGVAAMSTDMEGLVETSNNFATIDRKSVV